jgi:hypothetical protein
MPSCTFTLRSFFLLATLQAAGSLLQPIAESFWQWAPSESYNLHRTKPAFDGIAMQPMPGEGFKPLRSVFRAVRITLSRAGGRPSLAMLVMTTNKNPKSGRSSMPLQLSTDFTDPKFVLF